MEYFDNILLSYVLYDWGPPALQFELLSPLFKGKGIKASNKDNY